MPFLFSSANRQSLSCLFLNLSLFFEIHKSERVVGKVRW